MSNLNVERTNSWDREAVKLLKSHGVTRWPVNVERVASSEGIELKYEALDDELSGLCFFKEGSPVICVNAWHSHTRQRFTIAHEIGHIKMHSELLKQGALVDKTITILRRDTKSSNGFYRIEIEANQFAANLLMPKRFIQLYLREAGLDYGVKQDESAIEDMARAFQVSPMAMAIRIGNVLG